jgi:cell wall-associated NlpC family hydrolase
VDTSHDLAQARTGDLLFFGSRGTPERPLKVTHVAIYLGAGKFIHAPGAASAPGITINSFNPTDPEYDDHRHRGFLGARRIIGAGETSGVRRLKDIPYYNGHAD